MARLTFLFFVTFVSVSFSDSFPDSFPDSLSKSFSAIPSVAGSGKQAVSLSESNFSLAAQPENDFLYFVLSTNEKQIYDITFHRQELNETISLLQFRIKRVDEKGSLDKTVKRYCRKLSTTLSLPHPGSIPSCWNPITTIKLEKIGSKLNLFFNDHYVASAQDKDAPILRFAHINENKQFSVSYKNDFDEKSSVSEREILLLSQHSFSLDPSRNNVLGLGERSLISDKGAAFFITPQGAVYQRWGTHGTLVEVLSKKYHEYPHKLLPKRSLAGFAANLRSFLE